MCCYESSQKPNIQRQVVSIMTCLAIISLSYPALCYQEIHFLRPQENTPKTIWSVEASKYALSAYLKITPIYLLMGYCAWIEKKENLRSSEVIIDSKMRSSRISPSV